MNILISKYCMLYNLWIDSSWKEFGRNTTVDINIKELSSYIYDDALREEAWVVARGLTHRRQVVEAEKRSKHV